ncbi:MurR/RpiR family transcriptional regulator [Coralliovum pocilloporae]|uniref:MurR/RpiR family transcriptional regulator n=1 Tax=Coralliovum pocilloporae TaxID=3066369 RepID=UPI0033072862
MNKTIVPSSAEPVSEEVLKRLVAELPALTPELKKAAAYLVENPNTIGVTSMRELATNAGVKPNTLVRMARAVGFDSYEAFREPFRQDVRSGGRENFQDRARWLQSLGRGGKMAGLYAETARAAISGIEHLYTQNDAASLQAAADAVLKARSTYVLGVGVAHAPAENFAYLASMAVDTVQSIPRSGSLPTDDLARAGQGDVLLAMTFKPYRWEVVEAVKLAHEQGVAVIGFSDSPASPILHGAAHQFILETDSPQFFTSTVALTAMLETLMGFVIAAAGDDVVANIERFHKRRHELGIYCWNDD